MPQNKPPEGHRSLHPSLLPHPIQAYTETTLDEQSQQWELLAVIKVSGICGGKEGHFVSARVRVKGSHSSDACPT